MTEMLSHPPASPDDDLDPSTVEAKAIEGRSLWSIAWRRLRRDKVAMAGGVVVILLLLIAIFAPVITHISGHSYKETNNSGNSTLLDPLTNMPVGRFGGMSSDHWLGVTPVLGRDVFALLVYGARTSLFIALTATAISVVLGVTTGLLAGFYRGWVDSTISRTFDVLLAFPQQLLSISLLAVVNILSSSGALRITLLIFVLAFFGFPYLGRIVRGQVLSLREKEFVDAARSLGASNGWIMRRELIPNLVGPILVWATLTIPNNILAEAGLSFLGVGVQPPTPSWGQMLSDAGKFFQVNPTGLMLPGLAIFITVMAFNLFGDGLRDALDPKSGR